jgi:hypothetical protein
LQSFCSVLSVRKNPKNKKQTGSWIQAANHMAQRCCYRNKVAFYSLLFRSPPPPMPPPKKKQKKNNKGPRKKHRGLGEETSHPKNNKKGGLRGRNFLNMNESSHWQMKYREHYIGPRTVQTCAKCPKRNVAARRSWRTGGPQKSPRGTATAARPYAHFGREWVQHFGHFVLFWLFREPKYIPMKSDCALRHEPRIDGQAEDGPITTDRVWMGWDGMGWDGMGWAPWQHVSPVESIG